MYGDIQALGVYNVGPQSQVVFVANTINVLVFSCPGLVKGTDVVISVNSQVSLDTIVFSQPWISGAEEITISGLVLNENVTVLTSYLFNITVARSRSKNSGALL